MPHLEQRRSPWRKAIALLAGVAVAVSTLVSVQTATNAPPAEATYATGGQGQYGGLIDWLEWGSHRQTVTNGATASTSRTIGGQTVTTTCTINAITGRGGLEAYRSGTWRNDGLHHLYNIGGTGTNNRLINGLSNRDSSIDGTVINFSISCSTTLAGTPVEMAGLVIADAEASNTGQGEYVQATPNQPATWHLIERYRAPGCTQGVNANVSTNNTLRLAPSGGECAGGGPIGIGFMEGASGANFQIRGGGKSAIAIGVVLEGDFGDAPASYGEAGALYQSSWSGGALRQGTTSVFNAPLSTPQAPTPRLGARIDSDSGPLFSNDARGDDNDNIDDEDAVDDLGTIQVEPGDTHQQQVACRGPGSVAGWVDWNGNGTFDAGERSATVACTNNTATLRWTVPHDLQFSTDGFQSYMRLRIAANANEIAEPTGMSTTGEVEDHPLVIDTPDPELTLSKTFETTYGAPENEDDWTLTATPADGSAVEFSSGETQAINAGEYTLSELFGDERISAEAAGYDLADITCTTDGEDNPVSAEGLVSIDHQTTTECVLTNQDLPGSVVWEKTDTAGEPLSGSEWTLTGPAGFEPVVVEDNGEADADDRNGYFEVGNLPWGQYTLVESTAPEGYEPLEESFAFEVTGTDRDYVFDAAFENIATPTLTLSKEFDTSYGAPENPDDWNLIATSNNEQIVFEHGETRVLPAGDYTLTETFGPEGLVAEEAGYELQQITCSVDGESPQEVDGPLSLAADTATECTFTNSDLPGAVEWQKTNANGTPLGDSEWLLSGPDGFGELNIVDNDNNDVIDEAGTIRIEGLHWGDYTLEETRAPAGFEQASGAAEFTIAGSNLEHRFDEPFVNEPQPLGTLPLTGAWSGKWPLIGAGALALLVLAGFAWSLRSRPTT